MQNRIRVLPGLVALAALPVWLAAGSVSVFADGSMAGDKARNEARRMPETAKDRKRVLSGLYERLASAESATDAQQISETIEQIWLHSGSDTVNVLMERSLQALKDKKPELALKLLDGIVSLKPSYVEAVSRRAFIHFSQKEFGHALADLRLVLAKDPRHFKAYNGLATILREIGQKEAALKAYRRLREIHPFWEDIQKHIDELAREVEGQDI
jgi:tetratricopeptide (TPR) repeat protein